MTTRTRKKSGSRTFARTAFIELERRADGDASKARFPVSISSDAAIVRRDFDGDYEEVLSHDDGAIDLSRAPLPVIESHDRSRVNIGIVQGLRIERDGKIKKLRGELVLGKQARARELAADIDAGIVTGLSVGCAITKSKWIEGQDERRFIATRWSPQEVSIVSTPADLNVGIGRSTMKNKNKNLREEIDEIGADDIERDADETEGEQVRRYHPASREARAIRGERQRVSTIIDLVSRANLSDSFAQELIRDGVPLIEAREIIQDTMAAEQRRTQPNIRSQHHAGLCFGTGAESYDSPEFLGRSIGEALFTRVNPDHKPSEAAAPFIGRSMVELARECLHQRNVSTRLMAPGRIIERALGGLHGVSDFALALGDAMNRELLVKFAAADPGILKLGRRVTATDFRPRNPLMIGDFPRLTKVNEHGEYRNTTLTEAAASPWKLDTFGHVFGLSRQAMINDDLGIFLDIPSQLHEAAQLTEVAMVIDLLAANSGAGPTMSDNVALFHSSHKNLAGSGAVLSVTSLGEARKAMRLQTNISGNVINVSPKYLVVPCALETVAQQLLASISPTEVDSVNPFAGRLELVTEPRLDALSAQRWYLSADPAIGPGGLQLARLNGQGPTVDTQHGFRVDGIEFKISMDFAAGFVDHRNIYANPGAAPG